MAFKMLVELSTGFLSQDAYIRIHSLSWNRGTVTSVSLKYYKDQKSCEEGKSAFLEKTVNVEIESSDTAIDWRKQVYEKLKLEEEFKNAVDVLEEGQTTL